MEPDGGRRRLQLLALLRARVAVLEVEGEAAREPELEHIVTGNADANRHMIAINAELGFRVLDRWQDRQLDVSRAAALGQS